MRKSQKFLAKFVVRRKKQKQLNNNQGKLKKKLKEKQEIENT